MTKSGNDTIIFDNQSGESYQGDIVIHISEDTKILDAQNGFPVSPDSIQDGQTAYAYVGPAMTMSIPPQTNSPMILTEIPADYKAVSYTHLSRHNGRNCHFPYTGYKALRRLQRTGSVWEGL